MKSWNELIETAIIGTDKKAVDKAKILPTINTALGTNAENESYLNAVSLTHFYRKAGLKSQLAPDNSYIELQENLPVITSEEQLVLHHLLFSEYEWTPKLIHFWLEVIFKNNRRVNPVDLTRLLNRIAAAKITITQEQMKVFGEIGTYLAKRFEILKPSTFWSEDELTLNASNADIKRHLQQLRKKNNPEFIASLKKNWSSFALPDQLYWTRLLLDNPSFEEVEFARYLWENEFPAKAKETINYSKLRSSLATVLLSQKPGSFYRETLAELRKYIKKQTKGFLTKIFASGPDITIELSSSDDDFFNPQVFHSQFGLLLDNQVKNVQEERMMAYLQHLIAILPFEFWTELLESPTDKVFQYFKENKTWQIQKNGEKEWVLEDAFESLSQHSNDENFLLLYGTMDANYNNCNALSRLSFQSIEKALLTKKWKLDINELSLLFEKHQEQEFSLEFASFTLKESWKYHFAGTNYRTSSYLQVIDFMPTTLLPELEKLIYATSDSTEKTLWLADVGTSLYEYLKLKQRIEKL